MKQHPWLMSKRNRLMLKLDDGDFEKSALLTGLYDIRDLFKDRVGFDIEIYDLRQEKVVKRNERIVKRIKLKGDPEGYSVVDMGADSEFKTSKIDFQSLRGSECRADVMSLHHNGL